MARTKAQIDAEARYAERHEIVQVVTKFKTAKDVAMWKRLRERFPDLSAGGIARLAIKELARKGNG